MFHIAAQSASLQALDGFARMEKRYGYAIHVTTHGQNRRESMESCKHVITTRHYVIGGCEVTCTYCNATWFEPSRPKDKDKDKDKNKDRK